jgi:hypothetical protein
MKIKFSKIAYLGKLNQFNKAELVQHLKGYKIDTIETYVAHELIRFEGENTIIEVRFDLNGKFLGIESEQWLDIPLKVNFKKGRE